MQSAKCSLEEIVEDPPTPPPHAHAHTYHITTAISASANASSSTPSGIQRCSNLCRKLMPIAMLSSLARVLNLWMSADSSVRERFMNRNAGPRCESFHVPNAVYMVA
jgi:hypothetical protein